MEPFIGQIQAFGFSFAPSGWASCNGQLLSISENQALYALLGAQYGGDGRSNFRLPDLRGRVSFNHGRMPGVGQPSYWIGLAGGVPEYNLRATQLPAHSHAATGQLKTNSAANTNDPKDNYPAAPSGRNVDTGKTVNVSGFNAATNNTAAEEGVIVTVESTGDGASINNMPPYLPLNYCIALEGAFPPRN
ncbi:MAG: phage tail protein [Flavobacteriales bacterium]|nr:phage tail protein [Flavobacteriales bacterium]